MCGISCIFISPSRAPAGRTWRYIATPAGVRLPYAVSRLEGTKLSEPRTPTEAGVRCVQIERTLQHDAAREPPGPDLVVRAVDQGARPRPLGAHRLRGQRGRSDSVERLVGVEHFRAS